MGDPGDAGDSPKADLMKTAPGLEEGSVTSNRNCVQVEGSGFCVNTIGSLRKQRWERGGGKGRWSF